MPKESNTAESRCPSCNGFICKKIDQNARFPYQCMECGLEYPTLPLTSTHNKIWKIFEKLLNIKKEG